MRCSGVTDVKVLSTPRSSCSTTRSPRCRSAIRCRSRRAAHVLGRAPARRWSTPSTIATPASSCASCRASTPTAMCCSTSSRRSATSRAAQRRQSLTPTVSQRRVRARSRSRAARPCCSRGLISEREDAAARAFRCSTSSARSASCSAPTTMAAQRTELIIFIRPQIIRDGVDAHARRRGAAHQAAAVGSEPTSRRCRACCRRRPTRSAMAPCRHLKRS